MPEAPEPAIAIVSQNAETATHLRDYFESRRLRATLYDDLTGVRQAQPRPSAVILFPDEAPKGAVAQGLSELLETLARTTIVVVTSDTRGFLLLREQLEKTARSRLVVLPRPAFSWTLFEHVIVPSAVDDGARGC